MKKIIFLALVLLQLPLFSAAQSAKQGVFTTPPTPPKKIEYNPMNNQFNREFAQYESSTKTVKDKNGHELQPFFGMHHYLEGKIVYYLGLMLPGAQNRSVKEGAVLKLRTGNGKTYEGTAMYDSNSEMHVTNNYTYFGDPSKAQRVAGEKYVDFPVRYLISEEAWNDLKTWGIMKVRYYIDGNYWDFEFEEKQAKKAFEKLYPNQNMVEMVNRDFFSDYVSKQQKPVEDDF